MSTRCQCGALLTDQDVERKKCSVCGLHLKGEQASVGPAQEEKAPGGGK
jgi:hypothetical protein